MAYLTETDSLIDRIACHRTSQILQAAQVGGPTESQLFARRLNNTPEYYTIEKAKTTTN